MTQTTTIECLECGRRDADRMLTLREQGQTEGGWEFPVCAQDASRVIGQWYAHTHGAVRQHVLATGDVVEGRWISREAVLALSKRGIWFAGGTIIDDGAIETVYRGRTR